MYKRSAFTLAEVLITLGIIGIVAALTLPNLIAKYNKLLTVTRLKRQYSMYRQAKMLITPEINRTITGGDAEEAVEFYKEFYAPYIKSTSIKPEGIGVLIGLNDGSGMLLWNRGTHPNQVDFEYLIFCPRYKDCKGIETSRFTTERNNTDGIKSFMLYAYNGDMPKYHWTNKTREQLKELCQTIPGYCITLISYDGWEIKDDYPHIDKF